MYKLDFLVPLDVCEKVKKAVFDAGAGRVGHYDQCGWQTYGSGQFRPQDGSDPHVGQKGVTTRCPEIKVECVVEDDKIKEVVDALLAAHPYESVAYAAWQINEFSE